MQHAMTIQIGHGYVAHDEVRVLLLRQGQAGPARGGGMHREILHLQYEFKVVPCLFVVFNDEDFGHALSKVELVSAPIRRRNNRVPSNNGRVTVNTVPLPSS